MTRIALVVSDVDGTLLTRDKRLTDASSICWRKSGPVSMTTVVRAPFAAIRSTRAAVRMRRFFGLAGSQLPQSPVMRGVPGDEPQPRMVKRSVSATVRPPP